MSTLPIPTERPPAPPSGADSMICAACAVGLAAALIFSAFPGIDLWVSHLFYQGNGKFLFAKPGLGEVVRTLLRIIFAFACIAAVFGFILMGFFNRKLMGLGLAAWAYIGLCAAVGPGIVANLGFKDHWGRARPVHVTEFGGTKQFTPALMRTDQCDKNCSFISGEASNFFALGFAIALLADPARRRKLFLAAIAAGSFAGFIRIGGGGHFLSDVVFAGVFMAFVTRWLAWLMLERYGSHLAEGGVFHRRMLRVGRRTAVRTQQLWNTVWQRWQGGG
ncbi:MAG: phosphatase PAP2 family protein [Rhodomicrobiaceae bacterium]